MSDPRRPLITPTQQPASYGPRTPSYGPRSRIGRPPPPSVPRRPISPIRSNTYRSDTSNHLQNPQGSLALPSSATPSLPKPTSTTWSVFPCGVARTSHWPRRVCPGSSVSISSLTATSGRRSMSRSRKGLRPWRSSTCKLSMGAHRWTYASRRSLMWAMPHLSTVSNCAL